MVFVIYKLFAELKENMDFQNSILFCSNSEAHFLVCFNKKHIDLKLKINFVFHWKLMWPDII